METIYPLVIIGLVVGVRVSFHFADKRRIESTAQLKGWQDVVVQWAPFAPGWFFEKGERHYLVAYTDEDGIHRERYCKVGILTGVFWRDENS